MAGSQSVLKTLSLEASGGPLRTGGADLTLGNTHGLPVVRSESVGSGLGFPGGPREKIIWSLDVQYTKNMGCLTLPAPICLITPELLQKPGSSMVESRHMGTL